MFGVDDAGRHELAGLARANVAQLLEIEGRAGVDDAVAHRLQRATEGDVAGDAAELDQRHALELARSSA